METGALATTRAAVHEELTRQVVAGRSSGAGASRGSRSQDELCVVERPRDRHVDPRQRELAAEEVSRKADRIGDGDHPVVVGNVVIVGVGTTRSRAAAEEETRPAAGIGDVDGPIDVEVAAPEVGTGSAKCQGDEKGAEQQGEDEHSLWLVARQTPRCFICLSFPVRATDELARIWRASETTEARDETIGKNR